MAGFLPLQTVVVGATTYPVAPQIDFVALAFAPRRLNLSLLPPAPPPVVLVSFDGTHDHVALGASPRDVGGPSGVLGVTGVWFRLALAGSASVRVGGEG